MTEVVLDDPRVAVPLGWVLSGLVLAVAAVLAFSTTREDIQDPLVRQARVMCAEEVGDQVSDEVIQRGRVWTVGADCTLLRTGHGWQVLDVRG